MLQNLILLILIYKCVNLSFIFFRERGLLSENNVGIFMTYNYLLSLWLTIIPVLALSPPIVHMELSLFKFFRTIPHAFIAYIPLIFSSIELSRKLGRRTDIIYDLSRKIERKSFHIGFLSFAFLLIFFVLALGSFL